MLRAVSLFFGLGTLVGLVVYPYEIGRSYLLYKSFMITTYLLVAMSSSRIYNSATTLLPLVVCVAAIALTVPYAIDEATSAVFDASALEALLVRIGEMALLCTVCAFGVITWRRSRQVAGKTTNTGQPNQAL
jgi:hypothetical protein